MQSLHKSITEYVRVLHSENSLAIEEAKEMKWKAKLKWYLVTKAKKGEFHYKQYYQA